MESPFKAEILKGKVALLTGGASGIGYEISLQLGKHGASIAVMGRRKNVIDSAVEALQSHGIPVLLSSFITILYNSFFFWSRVVSNAILAFLLYSIFCVQYHFTVLQLPYDHLGISHYPMLFSLFG